MFSPEQIKERMKNNMTRGRMSPRQIAVAKKEMMKQAPESKPFFSMKVNPEGASIGNFVDNTRRVVADTKKFFTEMPSGSRRRGIRRMK
jgi:hypothetical protein